MAITTTKATRAAAATNGKRLGADTRHAHNKLRNNGEGRLEHHPGGLRHTRLNGSLLLLAHLRFHLAQQVHIGLGAARS